MEKAIVVYLDNSEKMIEEFSWLWKTWKLNLLYTEYDIVVYHHPLVSKILEKYDDIVKIEMPSIRISEKYKFLNSHYFCLDEWSNHLKKYKWILKTDCDVFLTKNLLGFKPSKFLIGQGGYYNADDTKKTDYLRFLAKKLNLNWKNITLVGASFFGKTEDVINVTKNQAILTELILSKEIETDEFLNSGFQPGIASMIAGELIINHIFTNQHLLLWSLDSKCWETTEIGSEVLHIHAWHTTLKWSKHDYFNGVYDGWIVEDSDKFKSAAHYCQWIATRVDKISVIIPTMWKSNRTEELLISLNNSKFVSEILLIDNCPEKSPNLKLNKIRVIKQKNNIYVNPAWNIGVSESKSDLICICNDDINFNVNDTFDYILGLNNDLWGCIGSHPTNYSEEHDSFSLESGYHTGGGGWGCLMFCKKKNWVDIPNSLKIGYGDDWLAITNKPNWSLKVKGGIKTEMSTTSSNKDFNPVVMSDIKIWRKIFNKD